MRLLRPALRSFGPEVPVSPQERLARRAATLASAKPTQLVAEQEVRLARVEAVRDAGSTAPRSL